MTTAKGRARARKAWATRRKRYGKDGVMNTMAETVNTIKHIRSGTQRRRPATHFFMGDQVKPISASKQGRAQWRRTVIVDRKRPGVKYEVWERLRVKSKGFPKGVDRWTAEWAHMNDPPQAKVKLVKML
jgi:hypothetical protein